MFKKIFFLRQKRLLRRWWVGMKFSYSWNILNFMNMFRLNYMELAISVTTLATPILMYTRIVIKFSYIGITLSWHNLFFYWLHHSPLHSYVCNTISYTVLATPFLTLTSHFLMLATYAPQVGYGKQLAIASPKCWQNMFCNCI